MNARAIATAILLSMAVVISPHTAQAQAGEGRASSATVLRPGDVLQVSVWPDPDRQLAGEFTVEETGYVYLPLVAEVRAAGVSIDELRGELRRRYGEAIRNPVVTVTPMFRVSVTGAVQRPGIHLITPTHALFDLIGMAGGFQAGADTENLRVVRSGEVIEYDALRALETGQGMDAIQLRSGDHVVVPVRRPPILTWRNALTVLQTISLIAVSYDRLTRSRR